MKSSCMDGIQLSQWPNYSPLLYSGETGTDSRVQPGSGILLKFLEAGSGLRNGRQGQATLKWRQTSAWICTSSAHRPCSPAPKLFNVMQTIHLHLLNRLWPPDGLSGWTKSEHMGGQPDGGRSSDMGNGFVQCTILLVQFCL